MSEIGLILALGCALISGVSLLCKHRGANHAPAVVFRTPLRSASALFRSGWWSVGFGLAAVAWALHMAALSMAPLSLVQAVIAGGLAMLALPARHWFGISIGPREVIGLGLSAAGLAFLTLTAGHGEGAGSTFSEPSMLAFEGGAVLLGGALMLSSSHSRVAARFGWLLLAAAAGLLLGVANVALKTLAETVPGSPESIASPLTLVAILGGIGTFLAFARSLQLGDAVAVIVVSSVTTTLAAIVGGVLVYGDPIGSDPVAVVARSTAFLAVIAAAALLPLVPERARESQVAPQPAT